MGYFTCVMSTVTGNLCNKCPKWLVKQNSSYSDYFNAISGFTSNSRAPGGPATVTLLVMLPIIFVYFEFTLIQWKYDHFSPTILQWRNLKLGQWKYYHLFPKALT